MATKQRERIRIIRHFKETTGATEVDMREVARFAASLGWEMPEPADPLDILAKSFSRAAREEVRRDEETGRAYRAYHPMRVPRGDDQLVLWVDIDEATYKQMDISLTQRREQMVGDALQITLDADHWNSIHPDQNQLQVPLDFGPDVEWRKNSPDEDED